jgi:putative membrane protein
MKTILIWIVNAIALVVMAHYLPGIHVSGFVIALIAALVIGFINATLGLLLKILCFPFVLLSFGLFLILINALMLKVSAMIVPGFQIDGFVPAIFASIVLSALNMLLRWAASDEQND